MAYFCIAAQIYDGLTSEQQDKLRGVASSTGVIFGSGVRMQDANGTQWQVFISNKIDCKLAADTAALGAIMLSGGTVTAGNEQAELQAWRTAHNIPTPDGNMCDIASLNAAIQSQGIMPAQGYASDGSELSPLPESDPDAPQ